MYNSYNILTSIAFIDFMVRFRKPKVKSYSSTKYLVDNFFPKNHNSITTVNNKKFLWGVSGANGHFSKK